MTPFFSTPDRIAALRAAAERWQGTPFAPGGRAACGPRGGASCHRLVIAVVSEAGVPWSQEEVPDAPLNRAAHHHGSLMADWLRAHRDRFAEITLSDSQPSALGSQPSLADLVQPGDVLLIRHGIGVHHAAAALDRGEIIQTLQGIGAHIVQPVERKQRQRLWAVFRPIDPAQLSSLS